MQSMTLPRWANGAVAATVVRWLKQPGDVFAAGDALVDLEIEDALVHLEASGPAGLPGSWLSRAKRCVSAASWLKWRRPADRRRNPKRRQP